MCVSDSRIDWLELNQRASKLLFRDKRRALHLYDIATQVGRTPVLCFMLLHHVFNLVRLFSQTKNTLLQYCNFVQWVPDSDVVVAQVRG